jgi:secreted trypsin-like serine protease
MLAGINPSEDYIAAGGETGHDTCNGDSGGPLLYYDKDSKQYIQSGITSFGSNTQGLNAVVSEATVTCARAGDVGFYYRADKELDWIQRTTQVPVDQIAMKKLWADPPPKSTRTSSATASFNHFVLNWLR